MSDGKLKHFWNNMLKIGTPECAIFGSVVAMALALLFLLVGFWRTVLIGLLMLVGAFIGGVKDKKQWCRDRVNKLFPAPRPYREDNEAIARAVRDVTGNSPKQDDEDRPEE